MTDPAFFLSTDFGTPDGDKTAHSFVRRDDDGKLTVLSVVTHSPRSMCNVCDLLRSQQVAVAEMGDGVGVGVKVVLS